MERSIDNHEIPAGKPKGLKGNRVIDAELIEGRLNNSLLKKVSALVEKYPAKAISVIREWMRVE